MNQNNLNIVIKGFVCETEFSALICKSIYIISQSINLYFESKFELDYTSRNIYPEMEAEIYHYFQIVKSISL